VPPMSLAVSRLSPPARPPRPPPPARPARPPLLALWSSAALHLLAWLPAAAMCFYAKQRLLEMHGYRIVARSLGRSGVADLSAAERLSFFREDALLLLVVVPWMLVVLLRWLHPTLRACVSAGLASAIFLVTFVQMRTFDEVGRFASLNMLRSAVQHLDQDPELVGHYLSPRTLAKILVPCATIVGLAWMALRLDPRRDLAARVRRIATRLAQTCLFVVLPLLGFLCWICFGPVLAGTPYHQSVMLRALAALPGSEEVDISTWERLDDVAFEALYRDAVRAPPIRHYPGYSGTAADCDVLFFVCETGPARDLDLGGDLSRTPTLARLRDHALVAQRHHTTYPYTNRALFSFFGGLYPSSLTRSFNQALPDLQLLALPALLDERGYHTAIYSPIELRFEDDDRMFAALGFEHFEYALHEGEPRPQGMRPLDEEALERLEHDLDGWLTEGRRFCVSFQPQVGHEPWPDVSADGSLQTLPERGRALFELQDRWLGRLVDVLERHGRLDRTLIVLTGDHGVRSRLGDPDLEGGRLADISFHVPLLIHAPMAFDHTLTVPWLSSHIDVAPTLAELMGLPWHAPMQGAPVWDEALADRITFFFGNHYLGADGYHDRGQMLMWSQMTDSVFATRDVLDFEDEHLLQHDAPLSLQARHRLTQMVGLQQAWVRHFSRGGQH